MNLSKQRACKTKEINMKKLVAVAALALSLMACQPAEMTACKTVSASSIPAGSDYRGGNPGKWIAPDADGSDSGVLGYAQEEDSKIYTTRACALALR